VFIAALAGINLLLLVGLVLTTSSLPRAEAQDALPVPGLASNYMFASGEVQDQFDSVYMIDTKTRKLYAFSYDRGRKQLELKSGRDLKRDFRNEGD
jgi:hypothetical protein